MPRRTEPRPEGFELALMGAIIGLTFFSHKIFDILFEEWITRELKDRFGLTAAEVIERLGALIAPGLFSIAIVWFLYRYLKSYFDRCVDELTSYAATSAFQLSDDIYSESRAVKWKNANDSGFYETVYYLVVGNGLDTGRTLKRVQARIIHVGEPVLVSVKETRGSEVDIRHGEWALFEIGKIISKEYDGIYFPDNVVLDDELRRAYETNVNNGVLSFSVYSFNGKREYSLVHMSNQPHIWSISLVVSADEVLAMQVRITIDMAKTKDPVLCRSAA
jgi:hypothetical protein